MATTQTFETVVTLNTQQAKNEIEALQKKIDDLKKKKEEAEAVDYEGVKVFPIRHSNLAAKPKSPDDKNELTDYRKYNTKLPLYR